MIAFAALIQLYLCQDVVRGGYNDIGQVIYDENKNSKFFILFSKYGTVLISGLVIPGTMGILRMFRTVHEDVGAEIGAPQAIWIWDDVINAVFWPMGMFGIFWTLYLRATQHVPESEKKQ